MLPIGFEMGSKGNSGFPAGMTERKASAKAIAGLSTSLRFAQDDSFSLNDGEKQRQGQQQSYLDLVHY
jgi:hypothetical protein